MNADDGLCYRRCLEKWLGGGARAGLNADGAADADARGDVVCAQMKLGAGGLAGCEIWERQKGEGVMIWGVIIE